MFNGINLSTIQDAKFGNSQVSSLYYGANLIWPTTPPPVPTEYFYIETYYQDTDIYLGNKFTGGMDAHNDLEYSLDKTTWNTLYYGSTNKYTKATAGKIYFRCTNPQISSYNNGMGMFCVNKDYAIGGNIMSLIFGANYENQTSLTGYNYVFGWLFYDETHLLDASNLILPATTLTIVCYASMFEGCTSLITAPALPATTLTTNCYDNMFNDCTSLTTAPTLPATTLAERCYNGMFSGCTSLTTAPTLPATTLAEGCYRSMFYHCPSLTTAPLLPATTLVTYCYEAMFQGCTSLNSIRCDATTFNPTTDTDSWVIDVSPTGTFYKDANTTWPTGQSGIPADWTVINV